jgi:glucosylceramidase
MSPSNRREFLKVASSAVALAGLKVPLLAGQTTHAVQAWVTAGDNRHQPFDLQPARGTATVRVDESRQFQDVLGFGAAFTDASCFLLSKMPADRRASLLSEFFSPSGLHFSVCRTCIGASDYSTKAYTYDDSQTPDPELKAFTIDHDREYILPTLRAARVANPELFLFATPWSPPAWMKTGGSLLGGSMQKRSFAPYADYFVRFLTEYQKENVKIEAVTVQNEVDTDQDGRMPAALWGQEYEIEFVKRHLSPAIRRAGLGTKIWILDHNYNLWGRVMDELGDPEVNAAVDGVAWHGYYGAVDAMTRIHDAYPSKSCYWTEGGPEYTEPTYATDWVKWSKSYTTILSNWARCVVGWNLLLDEQGRPNIGPFHCGGLITVNSRTGELSRSGQYWAFAHYSKHVQRGARVLASSGEAPELSHVAFKNQDGSRVLVLTNAGEAQQVTCELGSTTFSANLPADSIVTVHA